MYPVFNVRVGLAADLLLAGSVGLPGCDGWDWIIRTEGDRRRRNPARLAYGRAAARHPEMGDGPLADVIM